VAAKQQNLLYPWPGEAQGGISKKFGTCFLPPFAGSNSGVDRSEGRSSFRSPTFAVDKIIQ
ncbi:hypothetical protein, partial [Collinsella sp. UBA1693]|uniref:hypothetical protein n=1 Tax=Collinsella sp. UBA1693 TaxID=1946385 RepID=UPI00257B4BB5